jgi:AAA+ superfamily predicted ATPase
MTPLATVTFTPDVRGTDPFAHYWLQQATLRLRREICWLWRERALTTGDQGDVTRALPPLSDHGVTALDRARYDSERRAFFRDDVTARYLSERINGAPPQVAVAQGRAFARLVRRMNLQPVDSFVLALTLLPCVDSAAGAVIATCLNDAARTEPTLALAQRLWDTPDALLGCFDPAHALLRLGIIALPAGGAAGWHAPLTVPPLVARELLLDRDDLPTALERVVCGSVSAGIEQAADQFRRGRTDPQRLCIVPVTGAPGADLETAAAACAARVRMTLVRPAASLGRDQLPQLMTAAWLRGEALYLPEACMAETCQHAGTGADPAHELPLTGLPLWVFVGCRNRSTAARLASDVHAPIDIPAADYAQRLAVWRENLPAAPPPLLAEAAHRFRSEPRVIARVAARLGTLGRPPTECELLEAARADLDFGTLAQSVVPRFTLDELMLTPAATQQIEEIVSAVRNLARAHYDWGTAKAWNAGGLAALFAGPPGTGKTMCAEAIGAALSMPMYRIDLSQVVDKYVGQTEKNLRQLFDAADASDAILFFDEADALFGRRTAVKDAHDRYANLEVSYLLERFERFKGLAILATNRRKDLDEAFLRRLRFVVDFELPGQAERLRIWRSVIPRDVDASALDFDFLAQRFALSGGHIRGIVFHACLQCAAEGAPRALAMPAIVRAVHREYEKLDRACPPGQFGQYASLVAAVSRDARRAS